MIQFKQYATINAAGQVVPNLTGAKLLLIAKYLHQPTPRNIPQLYLMHENHNASKCWGLLFPDTGDRVPVSDYVNDEIPDKIVHYAKYEWRWVNGLPVLRDEPLVTGTVREELATAYDYIYTSPTSLVSYWYKRIETVFAVDLSLFTL